MLPDQKTKGATHFMIILEGVGVFYSKFKFKEDLIVEQLLQFVVQPRFPDCYPLDADAVCNEEGELTVLIGTSEGSFIVSVRESEKVEVKRIEELKGSRLLRFFHLPVTLEAKTQTPFDYLVSLDMKQAARVCRFEAKTGKTKPLSIFQVCRCGILGVSVWSDNKAIALCGEDKCLYLLDLNFLIKT